MKKFLVLFLILGLALSFAMAQETGFTVGLEFGMMELDAEGIKNLDAFTDTNPYLMPMIIYENSFLNGALDVYAELDYYFGFWDVPKKNSEKGKPMWAYFDLFLGYNLFLGSASTLSFIVENEFDPVRVSPWFDDSRNITGIFTPAVKFNQTFGFGDLYVMAGAPITYWQLGNKDAETLIDLDFTLGWQSPFGLGLEIIERNCLKPDMDYAGLDVIVSYENGPVYAEVGVSTTKEIKEDGITIIPEFDFTFYRGFTAYLKCAFDGVFADEEDVRFSPALGIKFSF